MGQIKNRREQLLVNESGSPSGVKMTSSTVRISSTRTDYVVDLRGCTYADIIFDTTNTSGVPLKVIVHGHEVLAYSAPIQVYRLEIKHGRLYGSFTGGGTHGNTSYFLWDFSRGSYGTYEMDDLGIVTLKGTFSGVCNITVNKA